ncbi:MAG TPA: DNA invertase, partial [Rhodobiaceae bacterium]|nr:DNA invertase [Rhodobiaceae bacterium]
MRERTPRGRTRWQPSSVKMLLERAERLGLMPYESSQDQM